MPRNNAGTMSLPAGQPVVTGTTIDATVFNTLTSDLSTEITDSLDRSGKGAMLAPLALANGTNVLPSLTFGADATTGIYRDTDGTIVITQGGDLIRANQAGVAIDVPLTLTNQTVSLQVPTPAANWAGFDGFGYWKSGSGIVYLQGDYQASTGAGSTIFTLAAGFRPLHNKAFIIRCIPNGGSTVAMGLSVLTTGVVILNATIIPVSGSVGATKTAAPSNGDVFWVDGVFFSTLA